MEEYLLVVDSILVELYSLALLASIFLWHNNRSYFITAAIVVAFEVLMSGVAPALLQYARAHAEYKHHLWFIPWAVIDAVAIAALYFVHKRTNTATSMLSSVVGLHYTGLAGLQCLGYIDEVFLRWPVLDFVYRFGVPALNVGIAVVLFVFILPGFVAAIVPLRVRQACVRFYRFICRR